MKASDTRRKKLGNFRQNIKTIRHSKRMSVPEFSDWLKVNGKRWVEVEHGRLNPNLGELAALDKEGYSYKSLVNCTYEIELKIN